jgi:hypothetical protein
VDKTERFGLMLTPIEKSMIVKLAELEGGLSQAALIRRLILQAARAHGLWLPDETCPIHVFNEEENE